MHLQCYRYTTLVFIDSRKHKFITCKSYFSRYVTMQIANYFSLWILFIDFSFAVDTSSDLYYHRVNPSDTPYRVLELNSWLQEFRHCYISLTVHRSPGFKMQFDPMEFPASLYYTHSDFSKLLYRRQYSSEFVRHRNLHCRVMFLITNDTEFIKQLTPSVYIEEFVTRHFVMCGPNPSWPCIALPSYILIISLTNQIPKVELVEDKFVWLSLRYFKSIWKFIIPQMLQENRQTVQRRDGAIDFYAGGAQLWWNSVYTEIRNKTNKSKYALSFKEVEEAEKKLWIETKGGKICNKQRRNQVNLVNQFKTHNGLHNLASFQHSKSAIIKEELKILIHALLLEEIEFYISVDETDQWENSRKVFYVFADALGFSEHSSFRPLEPNFIGKFVNYGSTSWNFATCVLAKSKITFGMYITPFHPPVWYCLLATLFTIPFILYVVYVWKTSKWERANRKWGFVYNILSMSLGSLLETSPNPTTRINSVPTLNRTYRTLIGHWTILAIFLTIGYCNEFVVNRIVPIPHPTNVTRFSQLESFRLYSPSKFVDALRMFATEEDIDLYWNLIFFRYCVPERKDDIPHIYHKGKRISYSCLNFTNFLRQFENSFSPDIRASCIIKKLNSNSSSAFHHDLMLTPYSAFTGNPLEKTYEALSTCGRRGLVEDYDIMNTFTEYTKLKNKQVIFSKGQESIYQLPWTFIFQNWNSEYLYLRMHYLIQSGIYHILAKTHSYYNPNPWDRELRELRKSTSAENASGSYPYSLQTSIITLFFIYLACIGGTLISFFLEIFSKRQVKTKVKRFITK